MSKKNLSLVGLALGLGLVGSLGCAQPDGSQAADERSNLEPAAADGLPEASSPEAIEVERWRRELERGGDARPAKPALEALVASGDLPDEIADVARLVLARAHAALGETEPAVVLLEGLLAAHGSDRRWQLEEEVDALLSQLLTGKSPPDGPSGRSETGKVAPFARVLAPYFPLEEATGRKDGLPALHMELLFFGGSDATSTELGTFNVRGAAIELRRESCSLCPEGVQSDIHTSRSGSWLGMPRQRATSDKALVVTYMDLEHNRVPARYEHLLPLPVAEVERRLAAGEGLYAARERDGAPPLVLVAAPRQGQLPDVERALASEKELPTEPVVVELSASLRASEIQDAVRASRPEQVRCYDALLAASPQARGRIAVSFAVQDGRARNVSVTTESPGLDEPGFLGCVTKLFGALSFPKSSKLTTVTYPIELSP